MNEMNEKDEPDIGEDSIRTLPLIENFCVRHSYLSYHQKRILSEDAKAFLDYVFQFKAAMERFNNVGIAEDFLLSASDYSA